MFYGEGEYESTSMETDFLDDSDIKTDTDSEGSS